MLLVLWMLGTPVLQSLLIFAAGNPWDDRIHFIIVYLQHNTYLFVLFLYLYSRTDLCVWRQTDSNWNVVLYYINW